MRLIDIDIFPLLPNKLDGDESEYERGYHDATDNLKALPLVDAVPVVRGEWIAEQKSAEYCEFRCSACDGSIGQTDQFDETEVKQFSEWYKYCPYCGARMDGEP